MERAFLTVLNMSVAAGWMIFAVLLLRLLFTKAPKYIRVILWGLAGLRLLCPFTPESAISLIPSANTVPVENLEAGTPSLNSGFEFVNERLFPAVSGLSAPETGIPALVNDSPFREIARTAAGLWLAGLILLLLYGAVSWVILRRSLSEAVLLRGNIRQSGSARSPFVFGLFRPVIYIPFGMAEEEQGYALAHERAHIRRGDHVTKPIAFFILALHWFNPLVWLAYLLFCRDMELACDEKAISGLDGAERKAYLNLLLSCASRDGAVSACPFASGGNGIRQRAKNIINYKKPAFWLVWAGIAACAAAAALFLTSPSAGELTTYARTGQRLSKLSAEKSLEFIEFKGVEVPAELLEKDRAELGELVRDIVGFAEKYPDASPSYSSSVMRNFEGLIGMAVRDYYEYDVEFRALQRSEKNPYPIVYSGKNLCVARPEGRDPETLAVDGSHRDWYHGLGVPFTVYKNGGVREDGVFSIYLENTREKLDFESPRDGSYPGQYGIMDATAPGEYYENSYIVSFALDGEVYYFRLLRG